MKKLFRALRPQRGRKMSDFEAKTLIESAQSFVREQRAQRANDSMQAYLRHGSHVTVGEASPLSQNFVSSADGQIRQTQRAKP